VADALTAVAHDDDEAKADERTLELAKANLTDARNAYGLGGGPMSDLLIAQSQLDHARLTLVEAQGQRLADIITLLAATAGDWRDPPSDLAAGNPNVH
jgi:outer membrane protein TolC